MAIFEFANKEIQTSFLRKKKRIVDIISSFRLFTLEEDKLIFTDIGELHFIDEKIIIKSDSQKKKNLLASICLLSKEHETTTYVEILEFSRKRIYEEIVKQVDLTEDPIGVKVKVKVSFSGSCVCHPFNWNTYINEYIGVYIGRNMEVLRKVCSKIIWEKGNREILILTSKIFCSKPYIQYSSTATIGNYNDNLKIKSLLIRLSNENMGLLAFVSLHKKFKIKLNDNFYRELKLYLRKQGLSKTTWRKISKYGISTNANIIESLGFKNINLWNIVVKSKFPINQICIVSDKLKNKDIANSNYLLYLLNSFYLEKSKNETNRYFLERKFDDLLDMIASNYCPRLGSNITFKGLQNKEREWIKEVKKQKIQNREWKIPFEKETQIIHNYNFTPITKEYDLWLEGYDMNHCVYSYLKKCLNGNIIIYSVKSAEDKRFTLEISNTKKGATLRQLRGHSNSDVPKSVLISTNKFIEYLNTSK